MNKSINNFIDDSNKLLYNNYIFLLNSSIRRSYNLLYNYSTNCMHNNINSTSLNNNLMYNYGIYKSYNYIVPSPTNNQTQKPSRQTNNATTTPSEPQLPTQTNEQLQDSSVQPNNASTTLPTKSASNPQPHNESQDTRRQPTTTIKQTPYSKQTNITNIKLSNISEPKQTQSANEQPQGTSEQPQGTSEQPQGTSAQSQGTGGQPTTAKEQPQTLNFSLYLIVLLVTLPIITVALLLIVPRKTASLIAEDISKGKKKINLVMKPRHRDDENL